MPRKIRRFGLAELILWIELCLIFFFSLRPAVDPDYGWHVANGRHVLDGVTFSGRDPYSWTAERVWVAHEWLAELVMNVVHTMAGASGNSVIASLLVTVAYAVVALTLRRRGMTWLATLLAIPVAFVGAMRSVGVRPQVLELLYLALLIYFIDSFVRDATTRLQFLLTVGVGAILWANTHGSFLLMPAVLIITGLELLVVRDSRWRIVLGGAVLSAVAVVINPWTTQLYAFAVQSFSSSTTLANIQEWQRPAILDAQSIPLLLQVGLVIVGIISILPSSLRPGVASRSEFVGVIRAAAFAILAFRSGRHVMLLGVAGAAMIAEGIHAIQGHLRKRTGDSGVIAPREEGDRARVLINLAAAALIALAVVVSGWQVISPKAQARAVAGRYPVGVVATTKEKWQPRERLFNQYEWGGFLIEQGIVPVFIDGRSELYGDRQLERYRSISHMEAGWQELLDSMGVSMVIMSRAHALPRELQQSGWVTLAQDSVGLLMSRSAR